MALFNDAASLLFTVKTNTDDARSDFRKLRSEIKETTDAAGRDGSSGFMQFAESINIGGNSLASFLNPAGLAAAAITGMTAAMAAGVSMLFQLTQQAAEYGDQVFDTAQKTNVGTDAIQAWNFAAEQSGSSTEIVNKSLAKFSTLLGQAANDNEKAQAILDKYNITAKDTDEALAQAVQSIMAMTDANAQNAAAAELFKDRGGDVINIIREMDGDMPGLIKKLSDMGLIMSREDVEAAAEFNDTMDLLKKQLASVGRTIGVEVMPVFASMAKDISAWLAKNPGEVKFWAGAFKAALEGTVYSIKLVALQLETLFDSFRTLVEIAATVQQLGLQAGPGVSALSEAFFKRQNDRFARGGQTLRDFANIGQPTPGGAAPSGGRGGGLGVAGDDAEKQAADERRKERQKAFEQELRDRDTQIQALLKAERDGYEDAQSDLEQAYLKRAITEEEFLTKSKENIQLYKDQVTRLIGDAWRNDQMQAGTALQIDNARLKANAALADLNKQIKREVEGITQTVTKANKDQETERARALKHWEAARKAQQDIYEIEKDAIDAEAKAHEDAKKFWNERRKEQLRIMELQEEADRDKAKQDRKEFENDQFSHGGLGAGLAGALGVELPSIFGDMDTIQSQADFMKKVYQDVAETAGQAIGSMVDGLAQLGAQWLITGDFSAKAALSMLASIAISIATQAAYKAILSYAEGVAETAKAASALAIGNVAGAALHSAAAGLHFAAAKTFAIVAAIAGGAGVALGLGARAAGGENSGAFGSSSNRRSQRPSDEDPTRDPNDFTSPFHGFRGRQGQVIENPLAQRVSEMLGPHLDRVAGAQTELAGEIRRIRGIPADQVLHMGSRTAKGQDAILTGGEAGLKRGGNVSERWARAKGEVR